METAPVFTCKYLLSRGDQLTRHVRAMMEGFTCCYSGVTLRVVANDCGNKCILTCAFGSGCDMVDSGYIYSAARAVLQVVFYIQPEITFTVFVVNV